jgi:pimeloyl-ACP methyl ester carboxylesterase
MKIISKIAGIFLLLAILAVTAQCTENSTEKARIMASEGIKTVPVGDIEMAYKVMGEGEPLVMIMGAAGTMDWWPKELVENLSSKYPVIIFDNRGMGYTTTSPVNFSISQFANDTAGLMDALGIEQANVLGISLGTFIGQELAIEHPEKVKRLILVVGYCGGPQAVQPDPEVVGKIQTLLDPANFTEQDLKNYTEVMFPHEWLVSHPDFYTRPFYNKTFDIGETSSPENLKRQSKAIALWPGTYDRLDRIKAPTLIVAGMEDLLLPPENSLIMANGINGSWLVRLENAGHGMTFQYPDELARIVADFIKLS